MFQNFKKLSPYLIFEFFKSVLILELNLKTIFEFLKIEVLLFGHTDMSIV